MNKTKYFIKREIEKISAITSFKYLIIKILFSFLITSYCILISSALSLNFSFIYDKISKYYQNQETIEKILFYLKILFIIFSVYFSLKLVKNISEYYLLYYYNNYFVMNYCMIFLIIINISKLNFFKSFKLIQIYFNFQKISFIIEKLKNKNLVIINDLAEYILTNDYSLINKISLISTVPINELKLEQNFNKILYKDNETIRGIINKVNIEIIFNNDTIKEFQTKSNGFIIS
ncbi:hypothetical protein, partial [Mycoplasma sp. Z386]